MYVVHKKIKINKKKLKPAKAQFFKELSEAWVGLFVLFICYKQSGGPLLSGEDDAIILKDKWEEVGPTLTVTKEYKLTTPAVFFNIADLFTVVLEIILLI